MILILIGFIIYDANKYNLDNIQGLKKQVLDAENNLYLVWNPKFDSVDVEGKINANDVIWLNPTKISPTTPSSSKSEMLNFDFSKFSRMSIDKVLTVEEVIRAKSRK